MNNVKDFGAKGDSLTLDTRSLQQAIDCSKELFFPAGIYLTGTLYLHSDCTLEFAAGAELRASTSPQDYNPDNFDLRNQIFPIEHVSGAHLLIAMDCSHIRLRGPGKINGQGAAFFDLNAVDTSSTYRPFYQWPQWRPGQLLYFCGCQDVEIADLNLEQPPYWCCFLHNCEDIFLHDLQIRADRKMINTDGIDIDCCRRVEICRCDIDCGDDGVAIRGNAAPFAPQSVPCAEVEVHHCRLRGPACGVRIGVGNGVIRDCRLHHLEIVDTGIGIGLCPSYSPGHCVNIENITISDCSFTGRQPLRLVPSWGNIVPDASRQPVSNIRFERFCGAGTVGSLLLGVAQHQLFRQISLHDVKLILQEPAEPPMSYHWPYTQFGVLNVANLPDLELNNYSGESTLGRAEMVIQEQ